MVKFRGVCSGIKPNKKGKAEMIMEIRLVIRFYSREGG